MCKISVVTSVYNCEKYIAQTIQSVIDQTFEDWEFIIINDCSKDKSADIIKNFNDKRIRFYDNEINLGQCNNLNFGIKHARGEYIARLDHDDICYPDRFQKQAEYMDAHPEIVLCGTNYDLLMKDKITKRKTPEIYGRAELEFSLCFGNYCLPHSSFMMRKAAMVENDIWYRKYLYAEDYDMLLQMIKIGRIDYIEQPLLAYRVFPEQFTQIYFEDMKLKEVDEIKCTYLDYLDFKEKESIRKAVTRKMRKRKDYKQFEKAIITYAEHCGIHFTQTELKTNRCLKWIYYDICYHQQYSIALLISYFSSPFRKNSMLFSIAGSGIMKKVTPLIKNIGKRRRKK